LDSIKWTYAWDVCCIYQLLPIICVQRLDNLSLCVYTTRYKTCIILYGMSNSLNVCFKKGTYYNPASTHYDNMSANVICDRCRASNLTVCIGFGQTDLCMQCISQMSRTVLPILPQRAPETATLMVQSIFEPRRGSETHTYMQQEMFDVSGDSSHARWTDAGRSSGWVTRGMRETREPLSAAERATFGDRDFDDAPRRPAGRFGASEKVATTNMEQKMFR
jgi:hypothetical protein